MKGIDELILNSLKRGDYSLLPYLSKEGIEKIDSLKGFVKVKPSSMNVWSIALKNSRAQAISEHDKIQEGLEKKIRKQEAMIKEQNQMIANLQEQLEIEEAAKLLTGMKDCLVSTAPRTRTRLR